MRSRYLSQAARERIAQYCAQMASSCTSDYQSSAPAHVVTDTGASVRDQSIILAAFDTVFLCYEIHALEALSMRQWWAEAECLIRDGWLPGDMLTVIPT